MESASSRRTYLVLARNSLFLALLSALLPFAFIALSHAECDAPAAIRTKLHSNASASTYAELGSWYGDHKQFACAAEAYESALKLRPGSSRLSYLLGLSLFSGGHSDAAVRPLQESIEIAPNVLKPHLILAAALEKLERKAEAKAEWQAALKIDPHSASALDGLARNLLDENKAAEVVDLLAPTPADESLILDLAQAYQRLKRFEDASQLLTRSLGSRPSSVTLSNMLARVEIQQFHYQAAEKIAEKTAKLHPADQETQRLYLQTLVLAGNTQQATPLARQLLAAAPQDPDLLYLTGVLEHDAGDLQAARGHLEQAVAAAPTNFAAHYNLGQVLAQLNDPGGAKNQLQKALDLGATEPEVHLELAKALRSLGETQAATEELNTYQRVLRQRQNQAMAASKTAQGDKEMSAGNPQRAADFYREALEATPDDAQLNYKLAAALDMAGDIPAERLALEKAIQINPDLAVAQNQLGFLASKTGDSQTAEKHFREAVRAAPSFTEAWVNLAAALGLQSRFPEAQEAVSSALRLDPNNPQALLLRETLAKAMAQH